MHFKSILSRWAPFTLFLIFLNHYFNNNFSTYLIGENLWLNKAKVHLKAKWCLTCTAYTTRVCAILREGIVFFNINYFLMLYFFTVIVAIKISGSFPLQNFLRKVSSQKMCAFKLTRIPGFFSIIYYYIEFLKRSGLMRWDVMCILQDAVLPI